MPAKFLRLRTEALLVLSLLGNMNPGVDPHEPTQDVDTLCILSDSCHFLRFLHPTSPHPAQHSLPNAPYA